MRRSRNNRAHRRGRSTDGLLDYLGGFAVTFRQRGKKQRVTARVREGRRRQARQAGAPARPPRPQPLRGRHGEVHRLRALRRCLSGQVHLRARRRQRSRRSGVARASASASSTRSTTCGASTATCASRPAPPRPSPSRKLFEFSFTNRADAIYTKAELVVDDDGLPQQLPWEDWTDLATIAKQLVGLGPCHRPGRQRRLRRQGRLVRRAGLRRARTRSWARPPRPTSRHATRRRPRPPRFPRRWPLMEQAVFVIGGFICLAGARAASSLSQEPGPLGAEPGGHPVRHRRAVHRPRGRVPRRGAGHRLRRRHRRAVPVRDHAARRRSDRRHHRRAARGPTAGRDHRRRCCW